MRYENRFFQLERQRRHYAPAKGQVVVCEGRDGNIAIEYRGQTLPWREIPAPAKPRVPEARPAVAPAIAKRKWVPPADHPWRQAARRAAERRVLGGAAVATRPSLALPSASP